MSHPASSPAVAVLETELATLRENVAALEAALAILKGNSPEPEAIPFDPAPTRERKPRVKKRRRIAREADVWDVIPVDRIVDIDYVVRRIGCTRSAAQSHLSRLHIKGLVHRTERGEYTRGLVS